MTLNAHGSDSFVGMIGTSPAIQRIYGAIQKVADSETTVLISGESGTGKELVARAIHQLSSRCQGPLIPVNCGAIPAELLESELFGHMKGAFTGAVANRQGRFELAHGGTIFLDEIGDMPILLQVKLLRVLQERIIEPVGGIRPIPVDVRIIAATNCDLEQAVKNRSFREDLYYRLNVIPIAMPPLRERRSDIPQMVESFAERFNREKRRAVTFKAPEVMDLFLRYQWPGNVRELENLIERLVVLCPDGPIGLKDLPSKLFENVELANSNTNAEFHYGSVEQLFEDNGKQLRFTLPDQGIDLRELLNSFENDVLRQALLRTKGNKNKASELLRMNRTTLVEKLKKKNLSL